MCVSSWCVADFPVSSFLPMGSRLSRALGPCSPLFEVHVRMKHRGSWQSFLTNAGGYLLRGNGHANLGTWPCTWLVLACRGPSVHQTGCAIHLGRSGAHPLGANLKPNPIGPSCHEALSGQSGIELNRAKQERDLIGPIWDKT